NASIYIISNDDTFHQLFIKIDPPKMEQLIPKSCDNILQTVNAYEPPKIEILEIAVEKGFADSIQGWNDDTWNPAAG
ncbi:MAG: hypothetical protein WCI31_16770, partial [Prolixibacteraceae bacterium]